MSEPSIAGRWTVAPGSWAAYRVTIIVPIFGASEVSGRTDSITGGADIRATEAGHEISAGQFTGDLTKLKSGDPVIDRQAATILQTDRHPTAEFALTAPIAIPPATERAGGAPIQLPGRITLLGVSRDVLVPATMTQDGTRLIVAAAYDFDPSEFGISDQIGGGLARLGDSATFEFSLTFAR